GTNTPLRLSAASVAVISCLSTATTASLRATPQRSRVSWSGRGRALLTSWLASAWLVSGAQAASELGRGGSIEAAALYCAKNSGVDRNSISSLARAARSGFCVVTPHTQPRTSVNGWPFWVGSAAPLISVWRL